MSNYTRNHYVPQWYQRRFFPNGTEEKKFYYLDLNPDAIKAPSLRRQAPRRRNLLRWGTKRCFCIDNLYSTEFGNWRSTEIEEKFFGAIDLAGPDACEYFASFNHPSADGDAFKSLLRYLSIQKLRTPKGLAWLKRQANLQDKNAVLYKLQQIQEIYCALWAECVWSIADASQSSTKFIISDHPVTVYNKKWFIRIKRA
jgi:hypothetical protein